MAGTTPGELMRAADSTLHWAKAAGGARWALFDPARHRTELARYALSAAIPAALDRGEFFLDYQPLTSLRDGSLLGVEALVRWRHPELGVLEPRQLHRAGRGDRADRPARRLGAGRGVPAGGELGGRRRTGAVRQRQPGRPAGEPPGSGRRRCAGCWPQTGLPPERLQLEITESTMMSAGAEDPVAGPAGARRPGRPDRHRRLRHRLLQPGLPAGPAGDRAEDGRGVRDRAAGPAGRPGQPTDERILASLVSLAHALDLTVTAEGVETADQADLLRAIGCDAGQGWHFGRPGPRRAHPRTDPLSRRPGRPARQRALR